MTKARVHVRLPTNLYARLCEEAGKSGASQATIVELALRAWFNPESSATMEARLLERLDAFDLRQSEIEREVSFTFEAFCHYVLYWLTRTEPLPDGERDAAHALGKRRFDFFLDQVAQKIGAAHTLQSHRSSAESDR
ncbi:hypothetical protein HY29_11415 [Hyphomonas beringensis]|uniref:Ribbon-helix-helix protein CopG domain-containing protein n=1 Tax=Hyphomonas beringensis TaxID=1280946 RepID=A0A062U5A4_9PROT|nr:hypothetical protein [Hyphomonas beringensis]KCZ55516.1 hypothetical protein HY29_11415 [Hyphomonas beringensis]